MLMDFLQLFFSVKKDTYHQVLTKSWKNKPFFFSNGVLIPTLHPLFKKGGSLRQPLKCDCFCKAPFLAGKNWDCFPNYLTDFRTKKWLMSGNWMPIVHPLVVWRVEGGVHLLRVCGGFQVQDCEKHVICIQSDGKTHCWTLLIVISLRIRPPSIVYCHFYSTWYKVHIIYLI